MSNVATLVFSKKKNKRKEIFSVPEFLAAIEILQIAFLRFQFNKQMRYFIFLPQRYFESTKNQTWKLNTNTTIISIQLIFYAYLYLFFWTFVFVNLVSYWSILPLYDFDAWQVLFDNLSDLNLNYSPIKCISLKNDYVRQMFRPDVHEISFVRDANDSITSHDFLLLKNVPVVPINHVGKQVKHCVVFVIWKLFRVQLDNK